MGQGPYVVDLKNAERRRGKGPIDVTYISIRLNPHISTRFFLVQRGPPPPVVLLNLPTGYLDTTILVSFKPVPSSQHAIVADARFSSPLFSPPIKHTCELQLSIHRTFTAEREQVSCHTSIDMCINNHAGNLTVLDTYTHTLSLSPSLSLPSLIFRPWSNLGKRSICYMQ